MDMDQFRSLVRSAASEIEFEGVSVRLQRAQELSPGDTYMAGRNTGPHLLTVREVDYRLGCVFSTENAYPLICLSASKSKLYCENPRHRGGDFRLPSSRSLYCWCQWCSNGDLHNKRKVSPMAHSGPIHPGPAARFERIVERILINRVSVVISAVVVILTCPIKFVLYDFAYLGLVKRFSPYYKQEIRRLEEQNQFLDSFRHEGPEPSCD